MQLVNSEHRFDHAWAKRCSTRDSFIFRLFLSVCVCVFRLWNRHRTGQTGVQMSTGTQSRGWDSLGPPRETLSCRNVRSRPSSGRWVSSGPGLCSATKKAFKHTPPLCLQQRSWQVKRWNLTIMPGLRSKFLSTICSSSFWLLLEEP